MLGGVNRFRGGWRDGDELVIIYLMNQANIKTPFKHRNSYDMSAIPAEEQLKIPDAKVSDTLY